MIYWVREIESKCASEHRVKFAPCMFMGRAIIWWSIQFKALGVDEAYATPWEELKKQRIREFRSGRDVARSEQEFNHLSTKESGLAFYTVHFEYLVTICPKLVNLEIQSINAYLQGLALLD